MSRNSWKRTFAYVHPEKIQISLYILQIPTPKHKILPSYDHQKKRGHITNFRP